MTRVAVLGAGGIVGQHMLIAQPAGVEAVYTRRGGDHPSFHGLDLTDVAAAQSFLKTFNPQVVVNLAGENRPDVVEQDSAAYQAINVEVPTMLAQWADQHGVLYLHISTQGVFGRDEHAPYFALSARDPANAYGHQKAHAEDRLVKFARNWIIVRLTFVLGVRPFALGRTNPLEQMFSGGPQEQVYDRVFSPLFADDAAAVLWRIVLDRTRPMPQPGLREIVHVGMPVSVSRYALAVLARAAVGQSASIGDIRPVAHTTFPGAARPADTTWSAEDPYRLGESANLYEAIRRQVPAWRRAMRNAVDTRAAEIAEFLGLELAAARERLARGFGYNHGEVAEDFRRANPQTDAELLEWYRRTDAYIWELSAYHLDEGFNYSGICRGIAHHLSVVAPHAQVLCLGDGIGDLSLSILEHGLWVAYHDLDGSRTATFARFRHERYAPGRIGRDLTTGWSPTFEGTYDAIVALDFMEHLPNVETWAQAIFKHLRPGGWACFQNAFGIGDPEHGGTIPTHLSINNRYEQEWDGLLDRIGFIIDPAGSGWRRKP